jgi:DNA-directed RNA polymerase subunit K/omega
VAGEGRSCGSDAADPGARSGDRAETPRGSPMSWKAKGSDSEVWTSSNGETPEGNFHLATIMFRRVLQLKAGARPRVDAANHKQGHVALLEVRAGTISWEVGLPVLVRS